MRLFISAWTAITTGLVAAGSSSNDNAKGPIVPSRSTPGLQPMTHWKNAY
jgi:hypothetical protein